MLREAPGKKRGKEISLINSYSNTQVLGFSLSVCLSVCLRHSFVPYRCLTYESRMNEDFCSWDRTRLMYLLSTCTAFLPEIHPSSYSFFKTEPREHVSQEPALTLPPRPGDAQPLHSQGSWHTLPTAPSGSRPQCCPDRLPLNLGRPGTHPHALGLTSGSVRGSG